MAKANPKLITAFRKTISKLKSGAPYQWGHMGACNCGNLAQEITHLSKAEIHQYAMQRHGDWNEQLLDYCPSSGYPMDLMISKLLEAGLDLDELMHLEKLSDPEVLAKIPKDKGRILHKNNKQDLLLYLETWVKMLEEEWADQQNNISFESLEKIKETQALS